MKAASKSARRFVIATVAFALILAVVPTAIAGKGGNRRTAAQTASLTVTPNPVPAWGAQYWGSGCGYVVGKQVNFVINKGTFFGAPVDARGCTSFTWYTGAPGTYVVEAYQRVSGRKQSLMGRTTFSVT